MLLTYDELEWWRMAENANEWEIVAGNVRIAFPLELDSAIMLFFCREIFSFFSLTFLHLISS